MKSSKLVFLMLCGVFMFSNWSCSPLTLLLCYVSVSVGHNSLCRRRQGEECSQVLWVPLICWFPLTARGGGHIHSYCLIYFSSSDSLAWKNSIGKEQLGILRLFFSYLIYAEHFSRNCLLPLVNTLSSLLLCIKASC